MINSVVQSLFRHCNRLNITTKLTNRMRNENVSWKISLSLRFRDFGDSAGVSTWLGRPIASISDGSLRVLSSTSTSFERRHLNLFLVSIWKEFRNENVFELKPRSLGFLRLSNISRTVQGTLMERGQACRTFMLLGVGGGRRSDCFSA